jgi:hypothetical protein
MPAFLEKIIEEILVIKAENNNSGLSLIEHILYFFISKGTTNDCSLRRMGLT